MNIVAKLLRKNLSVTQIVGFILSNFVGLAIVVAGVQFFEDVKSIWQDEDSFIKKDYLVVNKKITAADSFGMSKSEFTDDELSELRTQPWVRSVGEFTSVDYSVTASVTSSGRAMSTYMFFESVPSEYIDINKDQWTYRPGSTDVPVVMSKDYLTLYNFGFASSSGMPRVSENMMGAIPIELQLRSDDGTRTAHLTGRIVGFSNRLNTILVPEEFMAWSNEKFGSGQKKSPSRLIIDVSSPGDVAIENYLADHDLEMAGDKSNSSASFLLNVVTGVVLVIGSVITILSFFILMLSISLLMQKNRDKLHALIMLGYDLRAVGAPYRRLIVMSSGASLILALIAMWVFRLSYIDAIVGLTGGGGSMCIAPLVGIVLTLFAVAFNIAAVGRKVRSAFYNK
jgi:hypothetical protein